MKSLILFSCCTVIINFVIAQDIITLKSGVEKKTKIIKVNPTSVEYKNYGTEAPVYEEEKDNIKRIKYESGNTENFNSQNSQTSQYSIFHGGQSNSQTDSLLKVINYKLQQDTSFKNKNIRQLNQIIDNIFELFQQQKSNQTSTIEEVTKLKDDLQKQKETLEKNNKQLTDSITRINNNVKEISIKQEQDWKPYVFGLGLNVANINLFSEVADFVFDDRFNLKLHYSILFPFSFGKNFRLEPEISYLRFNYPFKYRLSGHDYVTNYTTSHFNIGIGILPMVQLGKTNITFGFRLAYNSYKFVEKGDSTNYEYSITATSFAPTVGAEYIFGNNFSLGAEGAVVFYIGGKAIETVSGVESKNDKFSFFTTQARFFVRMYF